MPILTRRSLWPLAVLLLLLCRPALSADLYYLGHRNDTARWDARTGKETRHSLGARWHATRGDWHWNIEGVYQFGRFDGGTISAWTVAAELGRAFPNLPLSPELVLRANVVSGDHRPGGRRQAGRMSLAASV